MLWAEWIATFLFVLWLGIRSWGFARQWRFAARNPRELYFIGSVGHGHWLWGSCVCFQVIAIRANEYHRPDRIRKPHSKDLKRWLPKKPRLPQKCLVRSR